METGASLAASDTVRKLQTALHAQAKGDPAFRFYTLSDKVSTGRAGSGLAGGALEWRGLRSGRRDGRGCRGAWRGSSPGVN